MSGDLTGEWDGIFNYPRDMPPNAFTASLRQSDTTLIGETIERSDGSDRGKTLHGWVEGECSGGRVQFVKSYDDVRRAHYIVSYIGLTNADATEITGVWDIPNVWSGTFIMTRRAGRAEEIERRIAETVR